MSNLIAEILSVDGERPIIRLFMDGFKFRCIRCASLCCRLGGPPLSRSDITRIKRLGYDVSYFSRSASTDKVYIYRGAEGAMKDKADGSCIFLRFDSDDGRYECSVYEGRPDLCRLFPFYIIHSSSGSVLLGYIPCCRGINDPHGDSVDESYISTFLIEAIRNVLKNMHSGSSSAADDRPANRGDAISD